MSGTRSIGKYTLVTPLTEGGMAELFLGFTEGPGGFRKYVVIKRLLREEKSNKTFVNMFADEAKITALLSHPNIGQVYDMGVDDEGMFIVMEFIAGQNLNQIVNTCAEKQVLFPLGFALAVARDCALALHYAHTFRTPAGDACSIVHRDVAQKNIMVAYDGQVRLVDFGIARVSSGQSKTRPGTIKGTIGYMSPEQVKGEVLDGQSDVFSLGIVLWESCTGQRLFSADTEIKELRLVLEGPIRPPQELMPHLSKEISAVVMKALSRPKENRFSSAKEFAKAIETSSGGLLFDMEKRSTFMKDLFSERILATQLLFDETAGNSAKNENYKEIGRAFQKTAISLPKVADRNSTAHDLPGMLHPKRFKNFVKFVVGTLLLLFLGFGVVIWMSKTRNTKNVKPISEIKNPSNTKNETTIPVQLEPIKPEVVKAEIPKIEPAKTATPKAIQKGELLLLLLPQATVFEGKKQIGKGDLILLTLTEGTHHLVVVGTDKIRRGLPVKMVAGKKTKLRIQVRELAPE